MRKLLYTLSSILMFASISMLGYKAVSATTCIEQKKNIIEEQAEKEEYLTPYGYTLDNPNIILNPYGNSPLTALILFETPNDEEITLMIKEKNGTIKFKNTFKSNTKHYIPVYGLYPDYDNEILIISENTKKSYKIKTEKLPDDMITESVINNTDDLSFLNSNGYLYALDSNNEVRWYLTEKYKYNISNLSNGNFLIPTSEINNDNYPIGIMEIDLLGKVYKQYDIENGYYGSYVEKDASYLVLSKKLIEIDKQTGKLLKEIHLENTYNNITFNNDTEIISLQNESETLLIDSKTNEKNYSKSKEIITTKELISPLYTKNNYILAKGIAFKINETTKESNKKIYLIGYKKIDENYKKHNIKIIEESNQLKVTGNFNDEEVYLILDKFLDKKIYDINYDTTIINTTHLKGKYSIYLKINDTIYRTNKYIKK